MSSSFLAHASGGWYLDLIYGVPHRETSWSEVYPDDSTVTFEVIGGLRWSAVGIPMSSLTVKAGRRSLQY